jgi:hypothetical protein
LRGRRYEPANLRHIWLLAASMLPQGLVFYYPSTRNFSPDWLAAFCLVGSLIGLIAFVWCNRQQSGMWILGVGLLMNLLVIILNGGFMPISPETAAHLELDCSGKPCEPGNRLGWSKDYVLTKSDTRLWWLSDCLLLPAWSPLQVAFSVGDIFIAMGAFWLLLLGEAHKRGY